MNYEQENYINYLIRRFGQQTAATLALITICLLAGLAG